MLKLFAWGKSTDGQTGLDKTGEHQWPKVVEVTGDVTFRMISAGAHHSLAVTTHGEIYSWGSGPTGELGHGYKLTQDTPTKITKLPEPKLNFKSVAAGHRHSLALTDDGQLYAWGNNQFGQLGLGHMKPTDRPEKINIEYKGVLKFIDIAAGADHSLALSDKGEIWSWGANSAGQLGQGDTKNLLLPKIIDMGNTDGPNDIYFNKISAGEYVSGALSRKGKVFTWGAGSHGRLGHGDRTNQLKPKLVEFFEAENMSMQTISVAYNHSAALNASGLLYMWGAALHGELAGNDPIHRYRSLKPTLVNTPGAVTFKSVQVGFEFAVATTYDGQLYTWGDCGHGRLGNNYNEGFVITPTRLDTRITIKEISVGRDHVIVLATGSEVPIFNAPAPLIVSRKRDKAIILETPRAPAENTPRQSPASEITNHVTSEVGDSSGAVEHHENLESSHAAADPVDASETSERDDPVAATSDGEAVAE